MKLREAIMKELYDSQTEYLKAVANIGQLRKQLADVSIDSNIHERIREGLMQRLDEEIDRESVKATKAINDLSQYMLSR